MPFAISICGVLSYTRPLFALGSELIPEAAFNIPVDLSAIVPVKLPFAINEVLSVTFLTLLHSPVAVKPSIVTAACGVCSLPLYVIAAKLPTVAPVMSFGVILSPPFIVLLYGLYTSSSALSMMTS